MQTATTIKKLSEAQRKFIQFVGTHFAKEIDYAINPATPYIDQDGNELHRFIQVLAEIVKTGKYEDRLSNELNSIRKRYDKIYKISKFKNKSVLTLKGNDFDGNPITWMVHFNREKTLDCESSFRQSTSTSGGIEKQPIAGYMFCNVKSDYVDSKGGFLCGHKFDVIRKATVAEAKQFEQMLRENHNKTKQKHGWT